MILVNSPPRVSKPEAQRQHVEKHDVFDLAGQHATLDRRAHGDHFVRIDLGGRLLAKNLFDGALDDRRPRLAAHEDHFVDVSRLQLGVRQSLFAGLDCLINQD